MKIAFVMIVFQSDFVLEPCLKSVLPYGKVYAAEGPVKYWQERGFSTSIDNTNAILEQYGVDTIHGQWPEKDEESNAALALVPADVDFIWVLDSDEIWRSQEIERIIKLLETDSVDSLSFKAWSFYGGFERWMDGFERNFEVKRIMRYYPGAKFSTHRPPTILAPTGLPFSRHRNHEWTAAHNLCFYHYSYVFPTQIKYKTEYYHARMRTIPNYFTRVYLPWVLGNSIRKQEIENQFDGVHDWQPSQRGECRTKLFEGEHPQTIQDVLPKLRARFDKELALWKN